MNKLTLNNNEKQSLREDILDLRYQQLNRNNTLSQMSEKHFVPSRNGLTPQEAFNLQKENWEADDECMEVLECGLYDDTDPVAVFDAVISAVEEEDEEEDALSEDFDNHDCTAGEEDGCSVCSEYLPDYIPAHAEEEDEVEECGFYSPREWDEDEDYQDDSEILPNELRGLGGEEQVRAMNTILDEYYNGEEEPIIL